MDWMPAHAVAYTQYWMLLPLLQLPSLSHSRLLVCLSLSLSLPERLALKPLKLHRLSLCGLRCEQQKCDRTLGAPPPFSPQSAPGQRSSADGYGSQYTLYFQAHLHGTKQDVCAQK